MKTVYNFSAGPSQMPKEVLATAAAEMLDYKGSGQSVMEMSHRSKWYEPIIEKTEADLRELMSIPDNYGVMFIQGGASLQFSMVPMNLTKNGYAWYVQTGEFAEKAIVAAELYTDVSIADSSDDKNYTYIPPEKNYKFLNSYCDYVHITHNNTIYGTSYRNDLPQTYGIPLVADMSSSILSEPMDITKYGLVYAGAQKNLGPAGMAVVIADKSLIRPLEGIPDMLQYNTYLKNKSMYNTPPTYSIYMMGLVLDWVKRNGGVAEIGHRNVAKAQLLYNFIDESKTYVAPVERESRSIMNVPFVLKDGSEEKTKLFVSEAEKAGLVNLGGHRKVGGMRASLYNAMPLEGVKALVDFMYKFERE